MLVLSLLPLVAISTHAQKQEQVCDVVARVNGETITKRAYLTALKDCREDLAWQMKAQAKDERKIDAELDRRKSSVLDALIDEFLLAQRGKELGFDADVELKRVEAGGDRDDFPQFEDALRKQGIDLEQAQLSLGRQLLGQRAIQIEVLDPICRSITDSERRGFYETHKEMFVLPATVNLSEVFLPFAGHSESEVEQRAVEVLAELRSGADFFKAVAENTPRSRPSYEKQGSLGMFRLDELKENLALDLAQLEPGGFGLMKFDFGFQIIRLDSRAPAMLRSYEDPQIQDSISRSIAMRRMAAVRESYIARLRVKSTLEVCPVK